MSLKSIGVFCSAREDLPEAVQETAWELGRWIGQTNRELVYGGVRKGLMEIVAQSVKKNGGRVKGIIPQSMAWNGMGSNFVDVEMVVADLADRKATMMREADAFVALPGGIGTLDEVFSVWAAWQVGEHHKPLFLINIHGFWDGLSDFIAQCVRQGYIRKESYRSVMLPRSVKELARFLEEG
ncbi:MAG: TIGR00730 family Rossman fold protein [Bacteroidaceae bacterium]|nr:TIGR00730 family Rossman fold protein [Bacteroidaceae bacterium]